MKKIFLFSSVLLFCVMAYVVWDPSFPFLYESGIGKKAIVIGATAGMGRETARLLMQDGYVVGCVGRRQQRLDELKSEFGQSCVPCVVDMGSDESITQLEKLIQEMGGCDLMMVCISASADKHLHSDDYVDLRLSDRAEINITLLGFWRAATVAYRYFLSQKSGHFVGVSSTSGLIGAAESPMYNASKAFMQRYLEAVRNYMKQHSLPIYVTDIIPGYVDVEWEAPGAPGEYWSADVKTAGKQIFDAIKSRKEVAYITKRWRLIAWLYKIVPAWLYNMIGGF